GRQHLEDTVLDLEDRDVERAAAKVVDRDDAAVATIETVRERCRCRLLSDAQHFEPGQPAGIARRRALSVVEIRRYGDDGAIDLEVELALLTEMVLGALLQLTENECRDLRRRELAIVETNADHASGLTPAPEWQEPRLIADVVDPATHESLD